VVALLYTILMASGKMGLIMLLDRTEEPESSSAIGCPVVVVWWWCCEASSRNI
jgi:hypothetical protein